MTRAERFGGPAAAALAALAFGAFAGHYVDGLWRKDAFDYAQIAREWVRGEGFASKQAIYALHLRWLAEHGQLDGPWPNLHRFPLPSLAIAAWFRVLGVGLAAVVASGVAFQAATAWLLFAWGRRAAGVPVAVAAVALFLGNGVVHEVGASGLAEPAAMFFFTGALFGVWRLAAGAPAHGAALAGVALGLAGLARTNVLLTAPLFALVVLCLPTRDGWREALARVAWLGAAAVAVELPWWLRNLAVAGSPFFSLHSYYLLPSEAAGLKWDATLPWVMDFAPPLEVVREHAAAIAAKWQRNTLALALDFPTFAGTLGAPLAALAAFAWPVGRALRPLAALVFAGFALTALPVGLTDLYFDKYYFHFLPAWLLLAAAVVWHASAHAPARWRALAAAAAVVVIANPLGIVAAGRVAREGARAYSPEAMRHIAEHTAPDAVIFSDQSEAVAWLADRKSVRRHLARDAAGRRVLSIELFEREFLPFDGVYLSSAMMGRGRPRPVVANTLASPYFQRRFPRRTDFADGSAFFQR